MEDHWDFDFDLQIWGIFWSMSDYFGSDFVEQKDVRDLFRDFSSDKIAFWQLWDSINDQISKNACCFED